MQREKGQDDYAFLHAIFNLKNYGIMSVFFYVAFVDCLYGVHSLTHVCESGQDCYAPRHYFMVGNFFILGAFSLCISFCSIKLDILFTWL